MKELKRVRIDEGTIGYLLALHFERDGLRALNAQLIRSGDNQGEAYERYLKEYKDASAAWGTAFHEIIRELSPVSGPGYTFQIDFVTGELVILRREEVG